MKNKAPPKLDSVINFLRQHEKVTNNEISELQNKISELQDKLTHTRSLINERREFLKNLSLKTRNNSDKEDMWKIIREALQARRKESSSNNDLTAGLSNPDLYKHLEQLGFEIKESSFRVYLQNYKQEGKIEKKGGRKTWTLVDN